MSTKINLLQTVFFYPRYIGQNIRLLSDMLDYTDAMTFQGPRSKFSTGGGGGGAKCERLSVSQLGGGGSGGMLPGKF